MALTKEQEKGVRRTVIGAVIFIIAVVALMVNKVTTPRMLSDEELRNNGAFVFSTPRMFTDFSLLDQHGNEFTKRNFEGKWSLVFFGFTQCPDICPTTLIDLNNLWKALPDNIRKDTEVVLVSLDPARDSAKILKDYVEYFNPAFTGVTGDFLSIRRFANEVNVAFMKVTQGDSYTIDHSANVVLINPRGDYHGFFKPPFSLAKLKITYGAIYNYHGVND